MPVLGTKIDKAAYPPCFGTDADPKRVSQEILTARAEKGDGGDASIAPGATAKSASGGRSSQLRLGLALVAKAPPASFKRNVRILLPTPALVGSVEPGAGT
jgi:hypothetical protein